MSSAVSAVVTRPAQRGVARQKRESAEATCIWTLVV